MRKSEWEMRNFEGGSGKFEVGSRNAEVGKQSTEGIEERRRPHERIKNRQDTFILGTLGTLDILGISFQRGKYERRVHTDYHRILL